MLKYYLHKIELSAGRAAISIDENKKPATTYTYLNDEPIIGADGERVPNKILWTLGAVETKNEANQLAFVLAEHYGCDVMSNGKLLDLPYMGKPGQWISRSEAAATLGRIKSPKKSKTSAENGRAGGRKKGSKNKPKAIAHD